MFFFNFCNLQEAVTLDVGIVEEKSSMFQKDQILSFVLLAKTQLSKCAPCEGFSQIASHIYWSPENSEKMTPEVEQ